MIGVASTDATRMSPFVDETAIFAGRVGNNSAASIVDHAVRAGRSVSPGLIIEEPSRNTVRLEPCRAWRREATSARFGHLLSFDQRRHVMKGDRVEIVIDAGSGTTRTYEVTATRAGRRVNVTHGRGVVEVSEVTRGGSTVRTARFLANRVLALVEHPAADDPVADEITPSLRSV
jgi:hypothetical protein